MSAQLDLSDDELRAFLNGIPLTGVILPKGQGDLVDRVRALIDAGSRAREA
jgi:hypothetical protein